MGSHRQNKAAPNKKTHAIRSAGFYLPRATPPPPCPPADAAENPRLAPEGLAKPPAEEEDATPPPWVARALPREVLPRSGLARVECTLPAAPRREICEPVTADDRPEKPERPA